MTGFQDERVRQWLAAIADDVISTEIGRSGLSGSDLVPADRSGAVGEDSPWGEGADAEQAVLAAHLTAMPSLQRDVLTLRVRDGLSYAQIAARLKVPQGTVHSRMARAKELIRARVDEEARGGDDSTHVAQVAHDAPPDRANVPSVDDVRREPNNPSRPSRPELGSGPLRQRPEEDEHESGFETE